MNDQEVNSGVAEIDGSCPDIEKASSLNNIPPEIKLKTEVFGIDFHPISNVVAAGEINGRVTLYSISPEGNKTLLTLKQHKKACRSVLFSKTGDKLYSCSKDKSIKVTDMNTGSVLHDKQKAHEKPINCMEIISENYMASGSDDGVVKIWDARTFNVIAEHKEHKEYISDMTCDKEGRFLLCTSGDGVLSVFNTRKKKIDGLSDQQDDELLSVKIAKNKQKVVCGSSSGSLSIFSWGEWGDISDRVPDLGDGIDSICLISDDVICTGSGDGVISAFYVQPHRAVGIIGKHGSFGIENLKYSPDKLLLGSSSETTIKFWDVSHLQEETCEPIKQKKTQRKRKLEESSKKENDFFADL
uniref:WD repeat-containing protein 55 n=1 Tax=Hydra vulgaris TaxID=6087 RepID=T2M5J7_HYDVU